MKLVSFSLKIVLSLLIMPASGSALAADRQLPPLVPDRPGVYCGSLALYPGVFHIETGLSYDRFNDQGAEIDTLAVPMVFRFGLVKDFELRISTGGLTHVRPGGNLTEPDQTGFASTAVGFKWQMTDAPESGASPSMALLFSVDLPVGSSAFRPSEAEPTVNFASDFALSEKVFLTTNIGVNLPLDSELAERYAQLFYAVALARSVTDRTALFVEIAGADQSRRFGLSQHVVDGGITHLLSDDVQLDVSLTRGLTRSLSDWVVAGGIALRFY